MRRLVLLAGGVAVLGGIALFLVDRGPSGPFPTSEHLSLHGFAVWPVDTVEEAEEECADAPDWRLDARATAERFAAEILRYPDPGTGEPYGEAEHHVRFLVNTGGARGLFLGSALDLSRFGRCWYVTEGLPREGELTATLGFVFRDGRPSLLLSHPDDVPVGFVGYGDWETEIDPGLRSTVLWMPELDHDATGHVIYTQPDDDGISEIVGARALGRIPPAPEGPPAEPRDVAAVVDDTSLCREGHRTPEAAIRHLFEAVFPALLDRSTGSAHLEREELRHLSGDEWRIVADDAVLDATIPKIGRCYEIVSMAPAGGDPPLRRLWLDEHTVTLAVDWGGGDDLAFEMDGVPGTLAQIRAPVTFQREPSSKGRIIVRAVLYKDGRVTSAYGAVYGGAP